MSIIKADAFYIDDDTGDFYLHENGAWLLKGNIRGSGTGGGTTTMVGTVDPTTLHNDGDLYFNSTSGDLFKQVASAWVLQGNFKGPQGDTGPQGPAGADGATGPAGADGAPGPKGDPGDTGPQGPAGADGARGSLWYEGAGTPGTISGQADGDSYLNTTNGDVYTRTAGSWGSPVGNIRGPAGADGAQGPAGADGAAGADGTRGSLWFFGNVAPVNPIGSTDGDFYINGTTGDLYERISGTWTLFGNIKGPAGADGAVQNVVFSVDLRTQTTGTSNAVTKMPYDTVNFDPLSYWDATNKRFKPLVAGYYELNFQVYLANTTGWTAGGLANIRVIKNGTTTVGLSAACNSTIPGAVGTCLVFLNGTTDYVEAHYFVQASNVQLGNGSAGVQVFSGALQSSGPKGDTGATGADGPQGDPGSSAANAQAGRLALSGANLILKPYQGNTLQINGVLCVIPDAGLTLAPTGLAASTLYYIYATSDGSGNVNGIEASLTAHATSTTSGNKGTEIKSGDDTRSFIGIARTTASTAWANSATQRFVRSWINRSAPFGTNHLTANKATTSSTLAELDTSIRVEVLMFAGECATANVVAVMSSNTASGRSAIGIGIDGTTQPNGGLNILTNANDFAGAGAEGFIEATVDGYHYFQILGSVGGGSGTTTIYGDTDGRRTTINVQISGGGGTGPKGDTGNTGATGTISLTPGAIGTYALGDGTHGANSSGNPYPGTWQIVSEILVGSSVAILMQRTA